jgi:two-component system KDP operon response regulator KdpE
MAVVLIVDDDVFLCTLLHSGLTKKGFQVEIAHDAISGLRKAYKLKPDVIILDVLLPDVDGWQTCRRFREMSDVPIIVLTALGLTENILQGLNLGADLYLIKPVTIEELAARIRALLWRVSPSSVDGRRGHEPILTHDNLTIDFDRHEVTLDGRRVNLSPTEFRLLSMLAHHRGRVLPHDYLLTEVWGAEFVGQMDYLRLYISYLRRKLEKDPANPSLIQSEWGVGYRLG